MDGFFGWLEATTLSTWLRDSPSLWAFPFVLILHTVGLAFMVGANVAWDVRGLGFLHGVRFRSMERYFLVMWGVSLRTPAPPEEVQEMVEGIRYPGEAAGRRVVVGGVR